MIIRALVGTNPTDEPITSGLPVTRPESGLTESTLTLTCTKSFLHPHMNTRAPPDLLTLSQQLSAAVRETVRGQVR